MPSMLVRCRPVLWAVLAVAAPTALALLARETGFGYLPRGYGSDWHPVVLWTHVISDSLITLACVTIPIGLLCLRNCSLRRDQVSPLIIFLLCCGASRMLEVCAVWHEDHWLTACIKIVTAAASLVAAGSLFFMPPRPRAQPSSTPSAQDLLNERKDLELQLQKRTAQLADATEAVEAARTDAADANRQKDRFLAKISHELRTPLQATLSWAHLLKQRANDPAKCIVAADRIMHSARNQAKLIDDLLDISRILSGQLRLQYKTSDPLEVVERAVSVVRGSGAQRQVAIDVSGSALGRQVVTDPDRLEQIVWNLVGNAVRASDDKGRVVVEVACDETNLTIKVRDWGQGIDEHALHHIFEPFRQGGRTENQHRGLGLGLAITRSIVQLFNGSIAVESDGVGQGALFTVVLPAMSASQARESEQEPVLSPVETSLLKDLRVLYVEDELDIAEATGLILEDLCREVVTCTTFATGREQIESGDFDVFLFDFRLDGEHTGYDLLEAARRSAKARPGIVLSAFGRKGDRDQTFTAGFAAHLVKPAPPAAIARALLAATAPAVA